MVRKEDYSPFFENFPLWFPRTPPIKIIGDLIDDELSRQYFNWLNRFPLKPVMLWKTYLNESEYVINYRLWSFYKLIEDYFGNVSPKFNIETIKIYNGNTDKLIYEKNFEPQVFNWYETLEDIYVDEDMDRFYCRVWFRGFKDYLEVGFPVTKGNTIKTIVPNREITFNNIKGDYWKNILNILYNDDSYSEFITKSVRKDFTLDLSHLSIPDNFKYENNSLRLAIEYETNGIIETFLDETKEITKILSNDENFMVFRINKLKDYKINFRFRDIYNQNYIDGNDDLDILVDAHEPKPPLCFEVIDGNDDSLREDIYFYLKIKRIYILSRSIENKNFTYKSNPYIDETAKSIGMWRRENYKDNYEGIKISETYPPFYQYDIEQDYYAEKRYLEEYYIERDYKSSEILTNNLNEPILKIDGIYPASYIRIDIRNNHLEVYNEEFYEHYLLDKDFKKIMKYEKFIENVSVLKNIETPLSDIETNDIIKGFKLNFKPDLNDKFSIILNDNNRIEFDNEKITLNYDTSNGHEVKVINYEDNLPEYYLECDNIFTGIQFIGNINNIDTSFISFKVEKEVIELQEVFIPIDIYQNSVKELVNINVGIRELQKSDLIKRFKINYNLHLEDKAKIELYTRKILPCIFPNGSIKIENGEINLKYHKLENEDELQYISETFNNSNMPIGEWIDCYNTVDATPEFFNNLNNDFITFDIQRIKSTELPRSKIVKQENVANTLTQLEYIINNNSKLIKIKKLDNRTYGDLKNTFIDLNTHGMYKLNGLLQSEFHAYIHTLVDSQNLSDSVMKWGIDEWNDKIWGGGIWDYGTFYIDVPLNNIPTNIVIPDMDHLLRVIKKTKKVGTEGFIRYVVKIFNNLKIKTFMGGCYDSDGNNWLDCGNEWQKINKMNNKNLKLHSYLDSYILCNYDDEGNLLWCKTYKQREWEQNIKISTELDLDKPISGGFKIGTSVSYTKYTVPTVPPITPPITPSQPVLIRTLYNSNNKASTASGTNHIINSNGYLLPTLNSNKNTGWQFPSNVSTAVAFSKDYYGSNYSKASRFYRAYNKVTTPQDINQEITDDELQLGIGNDDPNRRIFSMIKYTDKNYSHFAYARQFGFSFGLPDDYIKILGLEVWYQHANRTCETGSLFHLKIAENSTTVRGSNFAGESVPSMTYGDSGIDKKQTNTVGSATNLWGFSSSNPMPVNMLRSNAFGFLFAYKKAKQNQNINFTPAMYQFKAIVHYQHLTKCEVVSVNVNTNSSLATKWKEVKFNLAQGDSGQSGTGTVKIEVLNASNNAVLKTQTFTRALNATGFNTYTMDLSSIAYVNIKFRITMTTNNGNGRLVLGDMNVYGQK